MHLLLATALALAAELPLSSPTPDEVRHVRALVGSVPLPDGWALPSPAALTVAEAVASLPTPRPDPYTPEPWGLREDAQHWLDEHGPALAVLAASPDEALPLLRQREGLLMVRALLRDPTAAEPILGALHDPSRINWGGGGCALVYPSIARQALEVLTGQPFHAAYPQSGPRLDELRRVAGQPIELPYPDARPGSAEAAQNREELGRLTRCGSAATAEELLTHLALLPDVVQEGASVVLATITTAEATTEPPGWRYDLAVDASLAGDVAPGREVAAFFWRTTLARGGPIYPYSPSSAGVEPEAGSGQWLFLLAAPESDGTRHVRRIEPVSRRDEVEKLIEAARP